VQRELARRLAGGVLVAALDYTIPMIRIVPVLLWTSPDGVTGAAVTPDSLPTDLSDASGGTR
jgi:hypothetical protein